jgi:hypothetical protein
MAYNHCFLTTTFPRPESITEGEMIVGGHSFPGFFPLPDLQVRTVLLIKKEEYKEMKRSGPLCANRGLPGTVLPKANGAEHLYTDGDDYLWKNRGK